MRSIISNSGICINKAEDAADVLEAALEAYFRDINLDGSSNQLTGIKWNAVISSISFPSRKEKLTPFLEHCVAQGHGLLIYTYVNQRRTNGEQCKSIKDEEVLVVSLLDWLRHIRLRYAMYSCLPILMRGKFRGRGKK